MSMNAAAVAANLVRTELWSAELKEILQDELNAQAYVNWMTDFPDGDQMTIPSVGESTVRTFTDDTSVVYDPLDTGEFNFNITEYLQSGTYITRKAQQDSFYASKLEASFVPKQARALQERVETDVFAMGSINSALLPQGGGQATGANTINGAAHRMIATGADVSGTTADYTMALKDFAKALFALKKANVSDRSLIAIVDPSVEYTLNTLTNVVGSTTNARPADEGFHDIIRTSSASGMRFMKNFFGFDVYVSNYLTAAGSDSSGGETIGTTIANGVTNIFFSAADREAMPFVGAWRQAPIVDSEFNKDKQRTEYLTTARYGLKLYRPENFVTILSSTNSIF